MMILAPFIAFSMAATLLYKTVCQKKTNQPSTTNKLSNMLHKIDYALTKTATVNVMDHRKIRSKTHQALEYSWAVKKPSNSRIGVDKSEATHHNEQTWQPGQLAGNTFDQKVTDTSSSNVLFNDAELEFIRARYVRQSTEKYKIRNKNKSSHITGRDGKIFDAHKIIKVMQKKLQVRTTSKITKTT